MWSACWPCPNLACRRHDEAMSSSPPIGMASFACVSAAWQAHETELRGYLRHRASDHDAADDVLQDVFVKAMRQGQDFCTLDNPRAWLFQVARNALVDRARTAHPHEPFTEELSDTVSMQVDPVTPVDALSGCLIRTLSELHADDATSLTDLSGLSWLWLTAFVGANLFQMASPASARPPKSSRRWV